MSTADSPTPAMLGLVGNLTDDPELLTSKSGKPWMKARLSVKPFIPGASEQPTEFYDLVAFGSLAENVAATLHKGDRVVVTGKVEEDRWTGNDGVERATQKVIAEGLGPDLRFRGTKPSRNPAKDDPQDSVSEGRPIPNEPNYTDEPF